MSQPVKAEQQVNSNSRCQISVVVLQEVNKV